MRTNNRASAIIIRDDRALLIHRFRSERGEYYVFPGGGVESEETVEEALVREMAEELGIQVEKFEKLYDFVYQLTYSIGEKHDHYFLIREYVGEPKWMDGNEGDKENEENRYQMEWHRIDEIPNLRLLPKEMEEKILEIDQYLK